MLLAARQLLGEEGETLAEPEVGQELVGTLARMPAGDTCEVQAISTFSRTVSDDSRLKSWKMNPKRRVRKAGSALSGSDAMSTPSTWILRRRAKHRAEHREQRVPASEHYLQGLHETLEARLDV